MDYQHRFFWIEACRLLIEQSAVARVSLEDPIIRAFDDVVTSYSAAQLDDHGRRINIDHHQLKFYVDYARDVRGVDLADPKFINARRSSLLQRLGIATAKGDTAGRLSLITPWAIADGDPLRSLVSPRGGELNIQKLFAPDARKAMREIRDQWRAALGGVDDERFAAILRHLRIWHSVRLWQLDTNHRTSSPWPSFTWRDKSKLAHPYLGV